MYPIIDQEIECQIQYNIGIIGLCGMTSVSHTSLLPGSLYSPIKDKDNLIFSLLAGINGLRLWQVMVHIWKQRNIINIYLLACGRGTKNNVSLLAAENMIL
jgi:hypothetical protein